VSYLASRPVNFYWKHHYPHILTSADTIYQLKTKSTHTQFQDFKRQYFACQRSSRAYSSQKSDRFSPSLPQHKLSNKCEMQLANRQYASGVAVQPSCRNRRQPLPFVATGVGSWLHASRLCEAVRLASSTIEIMRDTNPNATRPAERLVGPRG
jgi:hypothetical protein